MRYKPLIARLGAAMFIPMSLLALSSDAFAQEVKSLRGKPSSEMILEALTPSAPSMEAETPAAPSPAPARRRRGLSLNTEDPAVEPSAAGPAVEAAPAQPASQQQPAVAPQAAPVVQQAAAPVPTPRPQPRALDLDIQFQFNSDQLTNDGKDVLDQLAAALKSDKLSSAREVLLEGHADAKGSAGYNQALSVKRAQSARQYLSSRHSIPAAKLRAVGKGSSEPADPANPESEINRRVRVIVNL